MLDLEVVGPVAVLTLRRPEARNAINPELARRLEAAVDQVEGDTDVRAAVLAADGPVFCAGADLKAAASGDSARIETERGGFAGFVHRTRHTPFIAAVDGPALAGGCEIVLACDLVVASTAASFGLPEVARGLIAGAGGLTRLSRVVGRTAAMELALTGRPITAGRAFDLGLVNQLVQPGTTVVAALKLAHLVAANAPLAVRESRDLVLASLDRDEDEMRRLTKVAGKRIAGSRDLSEGIMAFIEKRAPMWTST